MIQYNPKTWFVHILKIPKSDTLSILWQELLIMALYTAGLTWLLEHYGGENLKQFKNTISVHSLIGFVMGLFLVFRTNTAYDRWWEGRKKWGALVNCSRNLALKINAFIPNNNLYKSNFLFLISSYPTACKEHLRGNYNIDELNLPMDLKNKFENTQHLPNAIARELYVYLNQMVKDKTISGEELIIIDNELCELTDIIGACERIKNTPIPYSYSLFMKKFIFVYVITLPLGIIPDFSYWSIAVSVFIFYIMVSLEILAEEIEDPFGNDDNDLPTDDIAIAISKNIKEITR